MAQTLVQKIVRRVEELPENLQKEVWQFVKGLQKQPLKGVSGQVIAQFAGSISPEDLEIMKNEIELGCENIDENEW